MEKNKYSFLMSVYKNENPGYLKSSIESMLNQTVLPDEIVIVKDGPLGKDLSDLLIKYSNEFKEIFTIIELEKNLGLGLALNEGLKKTRNNLVARMDSDDISHEERCEKQLKEFIDEDDLVIVGTQIDEFFDNPKNITGSRKVPYSHDKIVQFSKRRNPFNHPTVMFKKNEVLLLGGYKNYRRNQDLDLFIRMISAGMKAKNLQQSLLFFRANKDNLKRRKSYEKCSSYVEIIYNSWRGNHSNLSDLIIVSISQIIIYFMPIFILDYLSKNFLRERRT